MGVQILSCERLGLRSDIRDTNGFKGRLLVVGGHVVVFLGNLVLLEILDLLSLAGGLVLQLLLFLLLGHHLLHLLVTLLVFLLLQLAKELLVTHKDAVWVG